MTSVKTLEALVKEGHRDLLEVCFCVQTIADATLTGHLDTVVQSLINPMLIDQLVTSTEGENDNESGKVLQQRRGLLKVEELRLYKLAHSWSQQLQDALVWMIETPLRK